jgi:phospholipid/cholesterol/gamma-HCH transport system substrate-binding protein
VLAAAVVAVVWLKNIGGRDDFHRYTIYFEHQSLDGLEVGGEVSLRGIRVGRVEDYTMAGQALNRVRVDVRIDHRAPVFTGTRAVVTRNFVTGIAAIALVNPDQPGAPLVTVPPNEQYPVIAEGQSDLEEITGRVNQVGEMASAALTNINALLNQENRDALMASVRSLRELSVAMQKRLDTLDGTLQQVGSAAGQVGTAAQKLSDSGERVAGVAEKGLQRLDGTVEQAERTMVDAQRALQRVAEATDAVQKQAVTTARRLEDTASGVDQQLEAAVSELRLSTEAVARTMDRLRDPKAALLGPGNGQLGPGEKQP